MKHDGRWVELPDGTVAFCGWLKPRREDMIDAAHLLASEPDFWTWLDRSDDLPDSDAA